MLLNTVARGIPLPLAGIENRRSIVYVGNLVSAIQACLTHSQAAGGVFEISDGPAVSTPEFVRQLAVALGRPPRLWPCPKPLFRVAGLLLGRKKDMKSLWGSQVIDESEIQSRLGWRPLYSMDEALEETVAAMRQDR
jgi:nucleoside-diphosphate-sugar epimerase